MPPKRNTAAKPKRKPKKNGGQSAKTTAVSDRILRKDPKKKTFPEEGESDHVSPKQTKSKNKRKKVDPARGRKSRDQ